MIKRIKFLSLLISLCLFFSISIYAEYNPPAGGEDILELFSPIFIGGRPAMLATIGPQADAINPSVSAEAQRPYFDFSYIGLMSYGKNTQEPGWNGHVINLGSIYPTPYAVFTGSAHLFYSSFDNLPLGTFFTMDFSAAKRVMHRTYFGSGLQFYTGGNEGEKLAFGIGIDFGLRKELGNWRKLEDVQLSLILRGVGFGYKPLEGKTEFPSMFTPGTGASFSIVQTESFKLKSYTEITIPAFQNLRVKQGISLDISDKLLLSTGFSLDVHDMADKQIRYRRFIPSFGMQASFPLKNLKFNSDNTNTVLPVKIIQPSFSIAPLNDGIWASGIGLKFPLGFIDDRPPIISIDIPEDIVISPNNDGIKDFVTFDIKISDERYLKAYNMVVADEKGSIIREIWNKDNRLEDKESNDVLDYVLHVESGLSSPKKMRWDGSDNNGRTNDGVYYLSVNAWDDNGNEANSPQFMIKIDRVPPVIKIDQPGIEAKIFSPNGDGFKDTIAIVQNGSMEQTWTAVFIDKSGESVYKRIWKEQEPQGFVWDGIKTNGGVVPDGIYTYKISSTDEGGNYSSDQIDMIIIATEEPALSLNIQSETADFSPNNDGVKDSIMLFLEAGNPENILEWKLELSDKSGNIIKTYDGKDEPPMTLKINGRDDRGAVLPEGQYYSILTVDYKNGSKPMVKSPTTSLDITPPNASARFDSSVFSPDGDGNHDSITFYQESTVAGTWNAEIIDKNDEIVKTFKWIDTVENKNEWDGRTENGLRAPDGEYRYRIYASDAAGNSFESTTEKFSIDTKKSPAIITAEYSSFSPNADGSKDKIRLYPEVTEQSQIKNWNITIYSKSGAINKNIQGSDSIDKYYIWDGILDNGRRAEDGEYVAELGLEYENGSMTQALTKPFMIDTSAPVASIFLDNAVFSPNGDGKKDYLTVSQDSSKENLWFGQITNSNGANVKSLYWKSNLKKFLWDGTDSVGNKLPDGAYRYIVKSEDSAGNMTEYISDPITIDSRKASIFATVSAYGLSPDGDNVKENIEFGLYTNLTEGIREWSFSIIHADGSVEKRYTGNILGDSTQIIWNGLGDDGDFKEGIYNGVFYVRYEKGDEPKVETSDFILDFTGPVANIRLEPLPFSPDNDGSNDDLNIKISLEDLSTIKNWSLSILDPKGELFNSLSGKGRPSENIIWDGRSYNGELVLSAEDYQYIFIATDILDNSAEFKGVIPIDILVMKYGEKLKVRIASITFEPDSAVLLTDDSEVGVKNTEILKRLVDLFIKYKAYKIRVEGHAVNISGTEEEEIGELMPLSEERAKSVMNTLVALGIDQKRISSKGLGGTEPVVPHEDIDNRWKNRRVEFILIK
jgi:flagellar hook assembly protein FlgD/outer membrane protein OmpA-like peptidoglycan-associated protein